MRRLLQKVSLMQLGDNKACNENMKMVKDPVCGMEIDEKKAQFSFVKNGEKYYFCSENCYEEFKKSK